MIKKFALSTTILLLLTSCSTKEHSPQKHIKHKVASGDLNSLRQEILMVSFDRIKSELERDDVRRRHALTLSQNLISLSEQMKDIPKDKIKNLNTPQDKELYKKYSQQLKKSANDIYQVAQNYELEKLPNKLTQMKQVCKTCHKRFKAEQ